MFPSGTEGVIPFIGRWLGSEEWLPFGGVIDSEGVLGSLWSVITFYI